MGRKKDTLQQRRDKMTHRRRYRYNKETPFIELFKPEFQRWLIVGNLAKELRSLLHNGDKINIRTMTYLDFRIDELGNKHHSICKLVYMWLAKLLNKIGSQGTRYGESMIFRYITDGHNNLFFDELSLKTSVNKYKRANSLT